MTLEEIKTDKEKLVKEFQIIQLKYQGALEFLAAKEKELMDAQEKESEEC